MQPIHRGLGRHIKICMGQEEGEWLEDDANLVRYEKIKHTASDRRILIATWYCRAYDRAVAMEGTMVKYFEHAGALLGTDDD